ncbi:MAG: hypothetical protein HPY70_12670 [Firmicutes bacterium]|nr:hypothetical protein [Bacillota bacterium]
MPGAKKVVKNAEKWVDRKIVANLALAANWAARMEAHMKTHAPWQDRTGTARAGLFAKPEVDGDDIVIRLGHSVEYGIYLELAHERKYAILEPTARKFARNILKSYRELWKE